MGPMHRREAWLFAELPSLVEKGVLTPETAEALRRHYQSTDAQATRTQWGQMLLAGVGAVLVGGGLVLILAHNWDNLGRAARAAIAIGILVAAQALTIFAVHRRSRSMAWVEATSGFLVAAVGGAIALVGQTYHVGGSFEDLMQTWLWLVLLVPYLTGSCLAAVGFWGLMVVRVWNYPSWWHLPWDPWLLALVALPFAVLRAKREPNAWATSLVVIAAAVAIFIVGSAGALQGSWSGLWAVFQVSFLGAVIAATWWPSGSEQIDAWRRRLFVPAWVALIAVGTILTFDEAWRSLSAGQRSLQTPNLAIVALVAVACAAFASIGTIRLVRASRLAEAVCTTAPVLVVVTHALALRGVTAGWIAFNLWLLAVGSLTIVDGVRELRLGTANRGLLALAALILSRFFDTDLSFLARGLAFVALGLACFALNVGLMRRLRTRTT